MTRAALAPVAVVVLLGAAGFGLAGRNDASLSTAPTAFAGWQAVPLVVAATGAWVLAATLVLARSSTLGYRRAFRRMFLLNLVLLALTALLVTNTALLGGGDGAGAPPRVIDLEDTWTLELDIPGLRYVAQVLLILLALGLGVALLTALTMLAWSLLPAEVKLRLRVRAGQVGLGTGHRESATPDALLATFAHAQRALRSHEAPRRAIIAAYAAMERAIVEHGLARHAAQTPTEFITAAIDDDLLGDRDAADRLLHLFELARFSHLRLPDDAVDVAGHCLDRLQADLRVPR